MKFIYLFSFIIYAVFAEFSSGNYDCQIERCTKNGPDIRFPFRLKGRQSENCGYPGFDLYCSQSNDTVMALPFSEKPSINETKLFIVKYIHYWSQSISLSKPDGCPSELLPTLNLSASPFRFEDSQDYTFFNCSSNRTNSYMTPISCLGSSNNYVYAVGTYRSLYWGITDRNCLNSDYIYGGVIHDSLYAMPLLSCSKMFDASSKSLMFLLDTIRLNWVKPDCGDCEIEGKYCRLKNESSIDGVECFPNEGSSKPKVIKGVVIGLPITGLVIFVALYYIYSCKKEEDQKRVEQFLEDYIAVRPSRYTYADLKKFTNHFKEKLGQGGYGTVYKGKLSNDILVAVKLLDNFKGNGEEFINEVGTIGRIHHVNVVRLLGYCADGYRRGLVYEFLPNDSLEKYISPGNQNRSLGWEKLQQIALGIAKGLDYLHQGCNQRILHFDIKPHNILLDHNFNPKVADFGLAKLCSKEQSIVSMTAARGTIGYIAPEVFSRNYGNVSYKADIYSFGMLLLDMVGGRKNFHAAAQDDTEVYFPEWMYNQLEKGEEISIQIDKEEDNTIFKKLTIVGLWCIQWYPAGRPSLNVVTEMIQGDDLPVMPPNPFASTKSPATNASVSIGKFFNSLEVISEGD